MDLSSLHCLLECQSLEIQQLRRDQGQLRQEVEALRGCLYSSRPVAADAEFKSCQNWTHWAQRIAGGHVSSGEGSLPQVKAKLQEQQCPPTPLKVGAQNTLQGASLLCHDMSAEPSTIAATSEAPSAFSSPPPHPQSTPLSRPSCSPLACHSVDCEGHIKYAADARCEGSPAAGTTSAGGLTFAASSISAASNVVAGKLSTHISMSGCGFSPSQLSPFALAQGVESAEATKDLADVKCRVYQASFAAKLHDIGAAKAKPSRLHQESCRW